MIQRWCWSVTRETRPFFSLNWHESPRTRIPGVVLRSPLLHISLLLTSPLSIHNSLLGCSCSNGQSGIVVSLDCHIISSLPSHHPHWTHTRLHKASLCAQLCDDSYNLINAGMSQLISDNHQFSLSNRASWWAWHIPIAFHCHVLRSTQLTALSMQVLSSHLVKSLSCWFVLNKLNKYLVWLLRRVHCSQPPFTTATTTTSQEWSTQESQAITVLQTGHVRKEFVLCDKSVESYYRMSAIYQISLGDFSFIVLSPPFFPPSVSIQILYFGQGKNSGETRVDKKIIMWFFFTTKIYVGS